jgi:hypothetical protein
MTNSPPPQEEKEKSTMIDPSIGNETSKRNFESHEVDKQPVYHSLSFCRFVEGFGCFVISNLRFIDVILSTECIFAEFYKLWSCFELSFNLMYYWNVELDFFCNQEAVMLTVESISLITMKDATDYYQILPNCFYGNKSESLIDRKPDFCLSTFLIEMEVNENFFVVNETESLDLEIFRWSESGNQTEKEKEKEKETENENDRMIMEMNDIRQVLELSGGSKLEDFSSFSTTKSEHFVEIAESVEIIRMFNFSCLESLKKVIFSSGNHLKEIHGFFGCISLCRIEIPSSVERIGFNGFFRCASLNEIVFSSDSHLREITGFGGCTSLCRIEIPSSVEKIGWTGFLGCTSLRVVIIRTGCRMRIHQHLRNMKPFLVYEEDDLKQHRSLIHLGFGRR